MITVVRRNILFYHLECLAADQALVGNPDQLLAALESSLSSRSAYIVRDSTHTLMGWAFRAVGALKLGMGRTTDLGQVEENLHLSPLQLQSGQRFVEITHARLFPGRVIGLEYNHRGPKSTDIARYLKDMVGLEILNLIPILSTDAFQALDRFDELTKVEITVSASAAKRVDSTLFEAFAPEDKSPALVRLGFSVPKRSKLAWFSANSLITWLRQQFQESEIETFIAEGRLEAQRDVINLLEPHLSMRRSVGVDEQGGAADSDDMFEQIRIVHEALSDEIGGPLA